MKNLYVTLISVITLFTTIELQAEGATGNDFVSIFDGETLNHWSGDPTYWRVEDGNLVGEVTPETILKRNTFIIWEKTQPTDFEIKMEYRISSRGNSGINYRSERIKGNQFALRGYQADLDGANRYTGQNYEERKRATLAYAGQRTEIPKLNEEVGETTLSKYKVKNAWTPTIVVETMGKRPTLTAHIKDNEWNKIHIIAKGNVLRHFVNGVLMSEVVDNDTYHRSNSGHIGVQVHVGPPMKVEFRNIMLKHLNGTD